MRTLYEKEDYSENDILSLIENEVEESITLDFKEAGALDKSDGKRKDISKDVSSFANSAGGLIIYGISEIDHKASALSFIDGNEYTKEWLEQVISSSIQRNIRDLQIFPIRINNNIKQSIYIVKIPMSLDAPHLSKDKRFYRRQNFQSVPMEEYEIRQLYDRKGKSEIDLDSWGLSLNEQNRDENILDFLFTVTVCNYSNSMETNYKVNAYIENLASGISLTFPRDQTNHSFTRMENSRIKISAFGIAPLFANETLTVLRFNFNLPKDKAKELLKELKFEIRIMSSSSQKQHFVNIRDLIDKLLLGE